MKLKRIRSPSWTETDVKGKQWEKKNCRTIRCTCRNVPFCFVVQLDQQEDALQRVSYSYADVLTETVELTFYGEPHNEVIL